MNGIATIEQIVRSKLCYWLNYYSAVNAARGRSIAELTVLVGQSVPGLMDLGHQIVNTMIQNIVDDESSLFSRSDEQVWIEYPDLTNAQLAAVASQARAVGGLAAGAAHPDELLVGFAWIHQQHQAVWADFVNACKKIMTPLEQVHRLLRAYKKQMDKSASKKTNAEYDKLILLTIGRNLREEYEQEISENEEEVLPIQLANSFLKRVHETVTRV